MSCGPSETAVHLEDCEGQATRVSAGSLIASQRGPATCSADDKATEMTRGNHRDTPPR